MTVALTSFLVEVNLSSVWTSITSDVLLDAGLPYKYGIDGNRPTDLIAKPGTFTIVLKNNTGKYTLGGASMLAGWGDDIQLRLSVVYDTHIIPQFFGYIRKIEQVYGHANEARTKVTVMDAMDQFSRTQIVIPSILRNLTSDQAARSIINLSPIRPQNKNFTIGDTVFPTVFDNVKANTYVFGELVKVANSEFAPLYIRHVGMWETLTLESGSQRTALTPVKSIPVATSADGFWLWPDGGRILWPDGGKIYLGNVATMSKMTDGFDISAKDGALIINEIKIRAYPRQVDVSPVVLASTGSALPVNNGASITTKLNYIDPTGGGRKVNAMTDYMQQPTAAGVQDPTLKTLLHFTADATDATGKHTWTLGEGGGMISDDVYSDGYGTLRVSSNILGPWGLFGGYANYYMQTPAHADFDFGVDDFTIGWFETRIDPAAGDATMVRDVSSSYPPFLLGYSDGTNLFAYFSSNGSSWDIGNARNMGIISLSKWIYYEVGRKDGWFFLSAGGQITDTWYSPLPFAASLGNFSVGLIFGGAYTYMGIDEFFVHKGKCLHTSNFTPPTIQKSIYLDEDYWGNTAQNRTGTDLTSGITITPTFGTEAVSLLIANASGSNGFVFCQIRGLGVYFNSPDEATASNAASIAAKGYLSVTLEQKYQQSSVTGLAKATTIVSQRATPRTDLLNISFWGNRSHAYMAAALYYDVGDLVQISNTQANVDGYYYIQAVSKKIIGGGNLYCTWTLLQDFLH